MSIIVYASASARLSPRLCSLHTIAGVDVRHEVTTGEWKKQPGDRRDRNARRQMMDPQRGMVNRDFMGMGKTLVAIGINVAIMLTVDAWEEAVAG